MNLNDMLSSRLSHEDRAVPSLRRDYSFDNIRGLLIFLVVFCHLLEIFCNLNKNRIYLTIYSFHMPCFLFVSGYFARFDAKKVVKRLLLPYAVFQILYTLFDSCYFNPETTFSLQFTLPYWITWYLLTVFSLYLLIPLLKTDRPRIAAGILVLLTFVSLCAGKDPMVGNTVSLSRTLTFLPCFFFGYYSGTAFSPGLIEGLRQRRRLFIPLLAVGVLVYELLLKRCGVSCWLLFGSFSYQISKARALYRLLVLVGSMVWMLLLLCVSPKRKIPLWSEIGARTMPIYLLHGFVQRVLLREQVFLNSRINNYLLALVVACAVVFVFSRKPFQKAFRALF